MVGNESTARELRKLTEETQFSGRARPLVETLTRLGYVGAPPLPDVPGVLDNIASSIEDEDPILYRISRAGERAYARWYEMGEDGSVFTMFGNYAGVLLRIGAYTMASGALGKKTAEKQIANIKKKYPVDEQKLDIYKILGNIAGDIGILEDRMDVVEYASDLERRMD